MVLAGAERIEPLSSDRNNTNARSSREATQPQLLGRAFVFHLKYTPHVQPAGA